LTKLAGTQRSQLERTVPGRSARSLALIWGSVFPSRAPRAAKKEPMKTFRLFSFFGGGG
jgi:hypothetical protein